MAKSLRIGQSRLESATVTGVSLETREWNAVNPQASNPNFGRGMEARGNERSTLTASSSRAVSGRQMIIEGSGPSHFWNKTWLIENCI